MKKTALAALAVVAFTATFPGVARAAGEQGSGATPMAGQDGAWTQRPDHQPSADAGDPRFSFGDEGHGRDARHAPGGVFGDGIARLGWRPPTGALLLSAGVVIGDIRVAALDGAVADGRDADRLHAPIEQKRPLAPYLGIGFRSPGTGLGFYGNAGMVAATVMGADPRLAPDQAIYPVLELGLSYRF